MTRLALPHQFLSLLDVQDWGEHTVPSRIDAAAGLMDSTNASLVLAALCRTDVIISSAFVRFSETEQLRGP